MAEQRPENSEGQQSVASPGGEQPMQAPEAKQQPDDLQRPGAQKGEHLQNSSDADDEVMEEPRPEPSSQPTLAGWAATGIVVLLAALVAVIAVARAVVHPRTDDAEIFANFIGMAPQVEGPITELPIHDNQLVHSGQLLFAIDDRPYRYALQRALSDQAALEGQIVDRSRSINAQINGIHVAAANIYSSKSSRDASAATIHEADADVADAEAAVHRAEADRHYAADNLARLEPLLAQQFVTVDQVDQARTLLEVRTRAVEQAEAQVALAEARVQSDQSHFEQSNAEVEQRRAQRDEAASGVQTLEPLTNQREERAAAVRQAQYNLNNCRVYAPFDGYITNLTTSLGAYAHIGTQVFTVIDDRAWWVVANFRETQLKHVALGSSADVFLMSHETLPLHGVVESIGFGVTPDPSVAGALVPGLPDVQRTLSWVHLAARYPVRIRIEAPPPNLLRIGQSAVAVVNPFPAAGR